jgi:site-specific DNA recombinase
MRAVIYARYSSDNQREASIEDQVRECRAFIERQGWTLQQTYSDRALSGASMLRPRYQRLLADARDGQFDVVVAEALDRLSRDQEDVAALHKRLSFAAIRIVTLAEGEITELHVGMKGYNECAVPEGPRAEDPPRPARSGRGRQVRWRQRLRL